jgi:DNA-binding NtrC family response regulator
MAAASELTHGVVLVVDDKYAVALDNGEYGRDDFERNVAGLPFRFEFTSAFDRQAGRYTVSAALDAVSRILPNAILLDIMFGTEGDRLGVTILSELTARFPRIPVVVMTALNKDETWQECARLGAVDYLPKPLNARRLWQTLDRYVGVGPEYWLLGQAPGFLEAVMSAAQASEGGRTAVMLTGDTGTGKELLARYIGRHGARAGEPFVPIHIAPMQPEQQQAELFGAKKGSYTGATQDRKGYFEAADKGVAFLDEIGDIDLRTQVNLLRVAESGEIAPLGEAKPRRVDVQIVSATNANLARKVKDGEFRQDLWERLRGSAINLPSLSQRVEDIPLLVRHLLRVEALARGKAIPMLPESIEARLIGLAWSGNVRELAKYAGRVFDAVGEAEAPSETIFLSEMAGMDTVLPHPCSSPEGSGGVISLPVAPVVGNTSSAVDRLQNLRLEEVGLLYQAVLDTRHKVTGALDRASAAALLKGKLKCSTNEFDRWLLSLWSVLDSEHRALAERRYPELLAVINKQADKQQGNGKDHP